jgi:hypothetical protein
VAGSKELLYTDFEGNSIRDPYGLILDGLDDERHRERVVPLAALLHDEAASDEDRLLACLALVEWGEPAGYAAVRDATRRPRSTPWYGESIDRFFSVDNTFGELADAARAGLSMARAKGTVEERTEALRALISIADQEYFDGKLEYALDADTIVATVDDIRRVVLHGINILDAGMHSGFDLGTQLLDLACVLIEGFEDLAIDLCTELVRVASSPRMLRHALAVVHRGRTEASRTFGEYIAALGGEEISRMVNEAIRERS